MNKTAIKNFAVWARNKLIADITYKAGLIGVSEKGIAQPLPQSSKDLQFFDIGTKDYAQVAGADIEQRKALVRAIQDKESTSDYKTAFKAVIEEVAYTWFNRLIAIRFMEVNDYLPSRIRVLSSENSAKNEPDFVTTPFDTDMEFTMAEQDKIMQLKDENKLDELFRMLFMKQCNKLHEILPELFEKTNHYTELLLSISFTDSDGVVYHLVHDIPEDDFNIEKEGQVEIIGWLYQFYNTEPKACVDAKVKLGIKVSKSELPEKTQIFTPDWVVRYMVENSLGRLWIEGHPNQSLQDNWLYYLEESEQESRVQEQVKQSYVEYRNINPEDIKIIDPCMGSGHILVYCFDVLMTIYESQGYTQRDAAQSILENNLFGLDVDNRAAQLAYFAVMMKGRQYDRRIFSREIKPNVYTIEESNGTNRRHLKYFGAELEQIERNKAHLQITGLLDTFFDAKEYGSILDVDNYEWDLLRKYVKSVDNVGQMSLDTIGIDQTQRQLSYLVEIGSIMAQKYDVAVTNPPYMGNGDMNEKLSSYIQDNYQIAKSDLFAAFILKCRKYLLPNRFQAMVTMQSWMNLGAFEELRKRVCLTEDIVALWHLDDTLLGIAYQTAAFILRTGKNKNYNGKYAFASKEDFNEYGDGMYQALKSFYTASQDAFLELTGCPIAYALGKKCIDAYTSSASLSSVLTTREGMTTGSNDLFLRLWYEIDTSKKGIKWFPYNKGGEFRRWYGNDEYLVNWENNGSAIRNFKDEKTGRVRSHNYNGEYGFREGLTWSAFSSRGATFRYSSDEFLFDSKGSKGFTSESRLKYILGFLNSSVGDKYLAYFAGAKDKKPGHIIALPYRDSSEYRDEIVNLVDETIGISKSDWDSFEVSWDFEEHPLVRLSKGLWDATAVSAAMHYYYNSHPKVSCPIELCYMLWQGECNERFNNMKRNEETLNSFFTKIYEVGDEVAITVAEKDVTVQRADLSREIRSLLSYAVGCMFGRYSLDKQGLVYAGGDWSDDEYNSFIPDKDNVIPVTDEEYLEDDIVARLCEWLKVVFGEDSLEINLTYIAKVLGNKGATSREVIRNYFLNDFMKDHIKMYQKRPIYWLFDSGKQNGFKALVYMHRWNADTVGNLRVEYLHKMQHTYEREIIRMQETIDNSRDSREVSKATKRKDKLQKQLKETKDYDAKLAHIALSRIEIDLDDGVKVNYEKVQTGRDGKKMQILAKI